MVKQSTNHSNYKIQLLNTTEFYGKVFYAILSKEMIKNEFTDDNTCTSKDIDFYDTDDVLKQINDNEIENKLICEIIPSLHAKVYKHGVTNNTSLIKMFNPSGVSEFFNKHNNYY